MCVWGMPEALRTVGDIYLPPTHFAVAERYNLSFFCARDVVINRQVGGACAATSRGEGLKVRGGGLEK